MEDREVQEDVYVCEKIEVKTFLFDWAVGR